MPFKNLIRLKSWAGFWIAVSMIAVIGLGLTSPLSATTPIGGDTQENLASNPDTPVPAGEKHGDAVHQMFDPKSIVWTVISFLLVLAALNKFVFPALNDTMKKREAAMRGSIEEAQRTRQQAQELLDQYEKRLGEARQEAQTLIEESRVMADQMRKDLVARAQEEATQMIQRAQDEIQQAKVRGIADLKKTVGELSLRLAAEVVRHDIDETKHKALVGEFLDRLQTLEISNRRA